MFDGILKMVLAKVDPDTANEFIARCNKAFEAQERAAKAQEEIALALRDLVERKKITIKKRLKDNDPSLF